MATKAQDKTTIDVLTVHTGEVHFCVLGATPLILNRMSQKAMRELLMPAGRKSAADKASNLKHNPYQEFRDSPYTDPDETGPTYVTHLASAFKRAIMSAALDLPGASKSQIGRLVWVEGERVAIYGIPQILLSVTRSADMNRTPDIRSRCIVPRWACRLAVRYVQPLLREQAVANLVASAGITQGVGDWRTGKGAGTYGGFQLVDADDPIWLATVGTGGRAAQIAAMANPESYDDESAEMLSWFTTESKRRGFAPAEREAGNGHG